jgi:hypothetical protein
MYKCYGAPNSHQSITFVGMHYHKHQLGVTFISSSNEDITFSEDRVLFHHGKTQAISP